jgi:hypothetical protein
MRPETAICLAMRILEKQHGDLLGFRTDIVKEIQRLQTHGVMAGGIRIRPGLEGPNSTEVSAFVGRLATTGHLIQESPIKLTDEGRKFIHRHLSQSLKDEREREDVEKALRILGWSKDELVYDSAAITA